MLIFIKTKAGKTISVEIEDHASIRDLKARIHEREDIPAHTQNLVFAGKPLPDSKTLSECAIVKESTLHLLIRVPETPAVPVMMESKPAMESKAKYGMSSSFSKSVDSAAPTPAPAYVPAPAVVPANPPLPSVLKKAQVDEIVRSFASTATSSQVEVVFCFDSTGSMGHLVNQVKSKISEISTRLIKDIPKIRIGIINHGDYCDGKPIDVCELTSDIKRLCNFVTQTALTGGGDSPEAYELGLQVAARKISWSDDSSKALVMIGDDEPHPPQYTTEMIDWKEETMRLSQRGVKIYGVYCGPRSQGFSEELAHRTGALTIPFSDMSIVTDMFLAVCYREASPEQLEKFAAEMNETGKTKNQAMVNMLETLAKPNIAKDDKKEEAEVKKRGAHYGAWFNYPKSMKPSFTLKGERWMPYGGEPYAEFVPRAATYSPPPLDHRARRKSVISRLTFGIIN